MTGLTPEERLANHQAGIKDASLVKRYGVRLLPELYAHPGLYLFAAGGKKNLNSLSDYSAATAFAPWITWILICFDVGRRRILAICRGNRRGSMGLVI